MEHLASDRERALGEGHGRSARMMVVRNANDSSWRRGSSNRQFVDGVLPMPSMAAEPTPNVLACGLSPSQVYQQQRAEQQGMVAHGQRTQPERHWQPFESNAPERINGRADVLQNADIHGARVPQTYVRQRVPVEHQEPPRIAPDGSVVYIESDKSHRVLGSRVASQMAHAHPAPRGESGWESAPEVVEQSQPRVLHQAVDHTFVGLGQVATMQEGGFEPTYQIHSYVSWDNKDLPGARPPGSPGAYATTRRHSRLTVPEQPEAASPRGPIAGAARAAMAGATEDSRYQPSWSPIALKSEQQQGSARGEDPAPIQPGMYGAPSHARGKLTAPEQRRTNTVWSMMHVDAGAGDTGFSSPRSRAAPLAAGEDRRRNPASDLEGLHPATVRRQQEARAGRGESVGV